MPKGLYCRTEETLDKCRANWNGSRVGNTNAVGSKSRRGQACSDEHKAKLRQAHIGMCASDETRLKMSKSQQGKPHRKGWKLSDEVRAMRSKTLRRLWQDPVYRDRQVRLTMKAQHIKPNIPESKLLALLEELYPGEWDYTGDGALIIGGRNPDFSNINGQKSVLELFGSYWHKDDNPQDKIAHYAQYGFRCLVIWEQELEDVEGLVEKIIKFAA